MKTNRLLQILLLCCPSTVFAFQPATITPVVVELFTAEGCSSCPPADELLAALARQSGGESVQIIALGEHVDYWNNAGWVDRFASSAFTQRQRDYAWKFKLDAPYTPQIVIDGRMQVVGNNKSSVYRDIESAASQPKPARITLQWNSPARLSVNVHLEDPSGAEVLLAITEDGLTTDVDKGENHGRTLRHSGVVRQLRVLGSTSKGEFGSSFDLEPKPGWNKDQLKIAVLVQEKHQGAIVGAAMTPYPAK